MGQRWQERRCLAQSSYHIIPSSLHCSNDRSPMHYLVQRQHRLARIEDFYMRKQMGRHGEDMSPEPAKTKYMKEIELLFKDASIMFDKDRLIVKGSVDIKEMLNTLTIEEIDANLEQYEKLFFIMKDYFRNAEEREEPYNPRPIYTRI